jgi:hypothetical protein
MRQNVWWHSICPAVLLLIWHPNFPSSLTLTFFQMTLDLAISLLRQGNNGDQILQILDSISSDSEQGTVTDFDGTPIVW